MKKLFIHPLILYIFIYFPVSNAHMMPGFLYVNKHKKEKNFKLNFKDNWFDTTNLTGKLCKNRKRENYLYSRKLVFLDLLIHVSISNLHNYFISEAF